MKLIENALYQEDIMNVVAQPVPWNKLQDKTLLISGATGLVGSFFDRCCHVFEQGTEIEFVRFMLLEEMRIRLIKIRLLL